MWLQRAVNLPSTTNHFLLLSSAPYMTELPVQLCQLHGVDGRLAPRAAKC
jgi:hypothetical protein